MFVFNEAFSHVTNFIVNPYLLIQWVALVLDDVIGSLDTFEIVQDSNLHLSMVPLCGTMRIEKWRILVTMRN